MAKTKNAAKAAKTEKTAAHRSAADNLGQGWEIEEIENRFYPKCNEKYICRYGRLYRKTDGYHVAVSFMERSHAIDELTHIKENLR